MAPHAISPPISPEIPEIPNVLHNKKESPEVLFDASKHLCFSPPKAVFTMEDLALKATELSKIAMCEPFPLLSREAAIQHRRELFSQDVLDNCLYHTRPGSVQLRGMAPRYAPFIHQFWHSPEVLKIVSDIAGVDLIPAMDHEISHTNVQIGPGGVEAVRKTPVVPPEAGTGSVQHLSANESNTAKDVVEWHVDSHPWVCIVMLTDVRNMSGGETELLRGDGTTFKVKGPQMGCAVLLQGRYITHRALPSDNVSERITIVTSFRPRDPLLVDDTTHENVRNESQLSELYYQWTTYRMEVLAQRTLSAVKVLKDRYEKNVQATDVDGKPGHCKVDTVDMVETRKWAEDMIKYINLTLHEMRPLEA